MVEYLVFQHNKLGETINTPCIIQQLAITSQCWEEVSMDFIAGLLNLEGNTIIMVVLDRLRKYAHVFSLSHCFQASTLVVEFMEIV